LYNLTITDSTISGNTAQMGAGGIGNTGVLLLANSTISGNTAQMAAGGIGNAGALDLTNSTLSGNRALDGGGLLNTTLTTNGGIKGSAYLTYDTIANNTAVQDGGGLENDPHYQGGVAILESIVAGNKAGMGQDLYGTFTAAQSLIQDTQGATVKNGLGLITGRSPALGPLQDNGGPTQTDALPKGSPAIDVATCHLPDPETLQPITFDQRGMPRPDENEQFCDLGAYESSR
jgi:hypothetical protein